MTADGRTRPSVAIRPVPWSASEAFVVVLVAHAALLVGGALVLGAGGWDAGARPIAADVAALVPFWVVGLAAVVRLAGREPGGALVGLGVRDPGGPRAPGRRVLEVTGGVAAGVATSAVLVPLVYAVVHRLAGTTADELERPARLLVERADSGVGVVLLVVATCIAAPVVEEALYRGVLLPSLGGRAVVAVVGSAVVFGVAHLQLLQLPGLVVIGLVLGVLRVLTGSLVAPVAAHVGFNVAAIVVLLAHR